MLVGRSSCALGPLAFGRACPGHTAPIRPTEQWWLETLCQQMLRHANYSDFASLRQQYFATLRIFE